MNSYIIDNFIRKNKDLSDQEISEALKVSILRVKNSRKRIEEEKKKVLKPIKKLTQYSNKIGGETVKFVSPISGSEVLLSTFKKMVMKRVRKNFCEYPKCDKKEKECFEVHHIYRQITAQKKIDSEFMVNLCWLCHEKTKDSYPFFGTAIEPDTEKRIKENKEINEYFENLRPFRKKPLQEVLDQELKLFKNN